MLEPEVYKRTVTFPVNPEDSQLVDLNFVRACLAVAVKHLGLVEQVAKLPASKQARAAESDSCWGPEDCVPANPSIWPAAWTPLRAWWFRGLPQPVASVVGELYGRFVVDYSSEPCEFQCNDRAALFIMFTMFSR